MKLKLNEKILSAYINEAILRELNEYGYNDAFLWNGSNTNQNQQAGNSVEIDPQLQQKINTGKAAAAKKATGQTKTQQKQPTWSDDHYIWVPPEQRAAQQAAKQNAKPSNYVEVNPTPRGQEQQQQQQKTQPKQEPKPAPEKPENKPVQPQNGNQQGNTPFTNKFKLEQFQTWYNLQHNFKTNVVIDGIWGPKSSAAYQQWLTKS